MSYIIQQRIKDKIYLYEVESYWDPQKKQARQRRKYLGKKDETGEVVTPRKLPVVSSAKSYGDLYLLQGLAKQIELHSTVFQCFDSKTAESILSLAYFQIIESRPLYLYQTW